MAELWAKFGGQQRSKERVRARRIELAAVAFLVREGEAEGNGRVHFARGVAVEVMRALGADERGQERRTGAKCRQSSVAGRPRRRARFWFRQNDDRLTELLWQQLTPKPERVRRWYNWQSWSTNWVLQHCQLEQELYRLGLKDMKLSKSIEQTVNART